MCGEAGFYCSQQSLGAASDRIDIKWERAPSPSGELTGLATWPVHQVTVSLAQAALSATGGVSYSIPCVPRPREHVRKKRRSMEDGYGAVQTRSSALLRLP